MTGCPHAQKASTDKEESNCGFNARLMESVSHASGFVVNSSSNSSSFLSKDRVVSSIPKGEFTPSHQTKGKENWEYPSEEMYFHAMKKKGWDPEAKQMASIVAIHNSVNEQSWKEVLKWESYHPTQNKIKLKRFMGKPTDYSPKARLMHLLGWSVLPFDRHDWIVDRDGQEVRYVIDFYSGQPEPGRPLSIYLDVRPALDTFENAMDRLKWQFREHIQPLLPFRGAFLNQNKQEEQEQKSTTQTNSTVVARDA